MRTIHRFHPVVHVMIMMFALTAVFPITGNAEEQPLAMVPAVASWEEQSGYRSVEASRAAISAWLAPAAFPTWDEASGYGAVEMSRAMIRETTRITGDELSDDEALAAKRAELFSRFRALELCLSQYLGTEHTGGFSCDVGH